MNDSYPLGIYVSPQIAPRRRKRAFQLLFRVDLIIQLICCAYLINTAIAIGLCCYGLVTGIVLLTLRLTYARNRSLLEPRHENSRPFLAIELA